MHREPAKLLIHAATCCGNLRCTCISWRATAMIVAAAWLLGALIGLVTKPGPDTTVEPTAAWSPE